MVVLNNGRVGIGTTSPSAQLQVGVAVSGESIVSGSKFFGASGSDVLSIGNSSGLSDREWSFRPVTDGVNTDLQLYEHGMEGARVTFQTNGNVGIGTTSPGVKLDVAGDVRSSTQFVAGNYGLSVTGGLLYAGARGGITGSLAVGGGTIWNIGSGAGGSYTGGYTTFSIDGVEKMRLDSSGNVGIGTTNPISTLDVTGTINATSLYRLSGVSALSYAGGSLNLGANTVWTTINYGNASTTAQIFNAGNVGIGTTLPASKLTVRGDSTGAVTELLRMENLGAVAVGTGDKIAFALNNASGAVNFSEIIGLVTNTDATNYSGSMQFKVATNGSLDTLAEFGNPNISFNRPMEVNVAGDTGINYDLAFMNTGTSRITSAGPLVIKAGSSNVYENLILSVAGDSPSNGGDIIADIRYSNTTFGGFKISGADNGGYVLRVDPNGNVMVGGNGSGSGNLTVKQNISLTGGNITVQKLAVPANITCVPQGTAGSSTYRFQITALNDNGETTASTVCETTTGNATLDTTNYVLLAWDPVGGATKYRVYGCAGAACTPTLDGDPEPHAASPTTTFAVVDSSFGVTALPTANTTGGNLAIGRASASYTLDVLGSGANIARFSGSNSTGCTFSDGGIIACSSDQRLKKNIVDLSYGIGDIMHLRPVSFNWNSDDDNASTSMGFIAQEVEGVFPKLVMTDGNGYKELNTIGLVPILTKAVQDQQKEIDLLQFGGLLNSTSTDQLANSGSGFAAVIKDILDTIGLVFENGVVKAKEFTADLFNAREANIEQIKGVKQIEMVDTATGQPYCTQITNGEWVKTPGACGDIAGSASSGANSSTPQAPATQSEPQPAETQTPAPATAAPQGSIAPEPQPVEATTTAETTVPITNQQP